MAARAAVSESTVSRVLRGSDLVAKVTRQRVEAALAFAETAADPTPESALDHIYAKP